jgi:hypothetical protein
MYKKLNRACFVLSLIGLAVGLVTGPAAAETLQLQFTGVDLVYDGENLYDAKLSNTTRSGNPAESDPLTSLTILHNNVEVGSVITSDIFTDLYITGIHDILAVGGSFISDGNGGAFGVDVLTSSITPGWGLALQINKADGFYGAGGFAFVATGTATGMFNQSLPFGATFDGPINFAFLNLNLSEVQTNGGIVTHFRATGTGVVAGPGYVVPEPSTLVLLGMGAAGLLAYAWRRRRS